MCETGKPEPSPSTTSSVPSYSEWMVRLLMSPVMLWEAAESISHFESVEGAAVQLTVAMGD